MHIEITELEAKLILSTIRQRKERINSTKGLSILSRLEGEIIKQVKGCLHPRMPLVNYREEEIGTWCPHCRIID